MKLWSPKSPSIYSLSFALKRRLGPVLAMVAVMFAAWVMAPAEAQAIDDPALDYFTITTPHFYVHYHSGLEELARRVATSAEEAHEILSPILDWQPKGRTHVNVVDKLDTANGWARVYGRNLFTVFGMPPQADSVLGHYDDWLRILVFHEYVHILHLDTNPGLPQLLNLFVGKQVHPNQVLPRWYVEGIATYFESATTKTGRVNSSLFRMWVRAAALDDHLFTLGQSTGLPIQWPGGSGAYLYGAFFIDYISKKHGQEFVRDFNHIYGRRLVPFSLNRTAREISGQDFDELWQEWTAHAMAESLAHRVIVRSLGETQLEYLTTGGGQNGYVRNRPGHGRISFYKADRTSQPAFATTSTPNTEITRLLDLNSAAGPSAWTPDGDTLVYSEATVTKSVYAYQDLFTWHAPSGRVHRLSYGERAREPAVSPDGKEIAYVRNHHGTMELVVRSMHGRGDGSDEGRVLVGGPQWASDDEAYWQQISMPEWSPDGRSIVFSWWRLDRRQRDLWLYSFEAGDDGHLRQLTNSASHEMDPHFGSDGLLYFASDFSGIYNIYAMDVESEQVWQVSNVVNGVFGPQLSEDGRWVYVSSYTVDGYEIARFPRPSILRHAVELEREPDRVEYPKVADRIDFESRPYQSWRWLAPQTLLPEFGFFSGGSGYAATISGEDPMERHSYEISGGWTSAAVFEEQGANLGAAYRYSGWPVGVMLTGRLQDYPRMRGFEAQSQHIPFVERQHLGRLSMSYPLRFIGNAFSLSSSYKVERTSFKDRPSVEHEPGDTRPREPGHGWFNELSFGLSFGQLRRYPLSVSTEGGVAASVGFSVQNEALGSTHDAVTFTYGVDAYRSNPLIERHAFALQLRGGITRSSIGPQRRFSIGGHAPQDVLTSVIFQEPRRGFPLRGYEPGLLSGDQFQLWKLEYRFPILDLDHGFSTLPVFFRQLKGSLFTDTGGAFDGYLADAQFRTGVGGELQLDAVMGYYALNTLRLGYARGLSEDGLSEWYLLFGGGF